MVNIFCIVNLTMAYGLQTFRNDFYQQISVANLERTPLKSCAARVETFNKSAAEPNLQIPLTEPCVKYSNLIHSVRARVQIRIFPRAHSGGSQIH
jgi:hypothetical protein